MYNSPFKEGSSKKQVKSDLKEHPTPKLNSQSNFTK